MTTNIPESQVQISPPAEGNLPDDVLLCARNTLGQVYVDGLEPRNIYINGHRTSMRLEPAMWQALEEISARKKCSVDELCSAVEAARPDTGGLSSAVRVFLLEYYRLGTQNL